MKFTSELSTKARDCQPVFLRLNQLDFNDFTFQKINNILGRILFKLNSDRVEFDSKVTDNGGARSG